ncbi:MAG: thioesterase [Proteobacteria bacterium]|nr:thioesterase [Pseudomonadota bacterium]
MFAVPDAPEFPADHATTWPGQLRYEDVAQDGRLMPLALPSQLGGLWRGLLSKHPGNRTAMRLGIVPILTRLVLRTTAQHVRLDHPVEGRGGYQLAHGIDASGAIDRLYLNMWVDVLGATGRLFPPEPAGALAIAGSMFAEHTFTRPFAPPAQRRVTSLPIEGFPEVAEVRYAPRTSPVETGEPPAEATPLDERSGDPTDVVFTLDQTDSNQHVNSLVYIGVFLDAAQRRFAALGQPLRIRSREVEIAYRKPCFAGDHVRVQLRAFTVGDLVGAAGVIVGSDDKPRCYVRTLFSP